MWYGTEYLNYCPGGEYKCPEYCEIDHEHLTEDCDENKKKKAYQQRLSKGHTEAGDRYDGDESANRSCSGCTVGLPGLYR